MVFRLLLSPFHFLVNTFHQWKIVTRRNQETGTTSHLFL
jgi:hypothetical protein